MLAGAWRWRGGAGERARGRGGETSERGADGRDGGREGGRGGRGGREGALENERMRNGTLINSITEDLAMQLSRVFLTRDKVRCVAKPMHQRRPHIMTHLCTPTGIHT